MSTWLAITCFREADRPLRLVLLALAMLVLSSGCATGHPPGSLLSGYGHPSPAPSFLWTPLGRSGPSPASVEADGSAGGFFEQEADAFQVVQEACGLGEVERHPVGAALYLEQAASAPGLAGEDARNSATSLRAVSSPCCCARCSRAVNVWRTRNWCGAPSASSPWSWCARTATW